MLVIETFLLLKGNKKNKKTIQLRKRHKLNVIQAGLLLYDGDGRRVWQTHHKKSKPNRPIDKALIR